MKLYSYLNLIRCVIFLFPVLSGCNQLSNQQDNINDKQNHLHMLGLRTIIYKVPDLQKAKEWYIKAFETNPYFDEPFYVGFNIGGYELGLDPDDTGEAKQSDNVLTYWGVKNIELEYERLLSLGASEHEKPRDVGGDIATATVRDPWGNVIGLIRNPHFKVQ